MSTTAANRVFAVPELLENILLNATGNWGDITSTTTLAKGLFTLLRVNKIFRNTIEGSAALQRFMFMAPLGRKEIAIHGYDHEIDPVEWLFRYLCEINYLEEYDESGRNDIVLCAASTYDSNDHDFYNSFEDLWHRLEHFRWRCCGCPGASWRRMRIALSTDSQVVVRIPVCIGNNGQGKLVWARWKFESDEKLDSLYQRWESLMIAMQQQVKEIEELNAQRAREDAEFGVQGCAKLRGLLT